VCPPRARTPEHASPRLARRQLYHPGQCPSGCSQQTLSRTCAHEGPRYSGPTPQSVRAHERRSRTGAHTSPRTGAGTHRSHMSMSVYVRLCMCMWRVHTSAVIDSLTQHVPASRRSPVPRASPAHRPLAPLATCRSRRSNRPHRPPRVAHAARSPGATRTVIPPAPLAPLTSHRSRRPQPPRQRRIARVA
jgi:hypothetical protein